jgi:hypothetical protein
MRVNLIYPKENILSGSERSFKRGLLQIVESVLHLYTVSDFASEKLKRLKESKMLLQ